MSYPTTAPDQALPSSPPIFTEPVTAPGLRLRRVPPANPTGIPISPTSPPTPSAPGSPGPIPAPDPIDVGPITRSGVDPAPRPPVSGGALRDVARGLVAAVGAWLNDRFATTPEEQRAQVWTVTVREQAGIGDPLASIAERHGMPATDNPDIDDLIRSAVAAAGYIGRNTSAAITGRLSARRARRALEALEAEAEQQRAAGGES